jgi:hypothetical protein
VTYTTSVSDYCGLSTLEDCELAQVTVTPGQDSVVVFYALASFREGRFPRLSGVSFGLDYDPDDIVIIGSGSCGDFEINTQDWPDPGAGTAVTWSSAQTGQITEVYWFAAYEATGNPATVEVIEHPTQGACFGDDSVPPVVDPIAGLGSLGFETSGYLPCPVELPSGASLITLVVENGMMDFDPGQLGFWSLESVRFDDEDLQDELGSLSPVGVQKAFPGKTPADTLILDNLGNPRRVPDLSGFYHLAFDGALARGSLSSLKGVTGVRFAEPLPEAELQGLRDIDINDPYFFDWDENNPDPQWHLRNTGARSSEYCGDAVEDEDIRIDEMPEWLNSYPASWTPMRVGIVSNGIWNYHEDLRVQAEFHHPDMDGIDRCGKEGSLGAGLAAAIVNNGIGVAGVCPHCQLYDINSAWPADPWSHCGNPSFEAPVHPEVWPAAVVEAIDYTSEIQRTCSWPSACRSPS